MLAIAMAVQYDDAHVLGSPLSAIQGHVTLKVGVVSKDHMILSTFKIQFTSRL